MRPDLLQASLFEKILIRPFEDKELGVDNLLVASGYATSAMGFHHLDYFRKYDKKPQISLIYGMAKRDGVVKSDHQGFLSLASKFQNSFACKYLMTGEESHSKVYIWCRGQTPVLAFSGSANYTQTALVNGIRREVLSECSPRQAYAYFKALAKDSVNCTSKDALDLIREPFLACRDSMVNPATKMPPVSIRKQKESSPVIPIDDKDSQFFGFAKVAVSLLDQRTQQVPPRSGLNWGQRPEYNRNPDQAYLSLSAPVCRTAFFPPREIHFTVLTDDSQIFECVRAQDNGKGIHTPHDNAEIGRYFRDRIGVPRGTLVTLNHLLKYGRTTVDFYKIDDENFFMDFSKHTEKDS